MNAEEKEIIKRTFASYFNREFPASALASAFFPNEDECYMYFKNVLYFRKAVIEPLERQGMSHTDRIVDLACGDGQMSVALYLLGYPNVTLYDLDTERVKFGLKVIRFFIGEDPTVPVINDTAGNMKNDYDVIISYQTIEHLSDTGNYSEASRSCQKEFLTIINKKIRKLAYINAPNYSYPVDGHDTGKYSFHFLPMGIRRFLIRKVKLVKCSWAGIAQPVSVSFLNRYLRNFRLATRYYAFDSMDEYMKNYPPFDYMGNRYPAYQPDQMGFSKKIFRRVAGFLSYNTHYLLPTLSVIYKRVS